MLSLQQRCPAPDCCSFGKHVTSAPIWCRSRPDAGLCARCTAGLGAQAGLTQFQLLDETAQETQLAIEESMNKNTVAVIMCAISCMGNTAAVPRPHMLSHASLIAHGAV